MNLKEEKKFLRLTYAVYIISTIIMILVLIGFTLMQKTALRSMMFLLSYILEVFLFLILAFRKKIKERLVGYIVYVVISGVFSLFTIVYFFNKFDNIIYVIRKVING